MLTNNDRPDIYADHLQNDSREMNTEQLFNSDS